MNKIEKKAYEELKKRGFIVEKVIRTKWHRIDFFGCFDFIAVKKDRVLFVQVSSRYLSSRPQELQRKLRTFSCPRSCFKQYWRWDKKHKTFDITSI